MGLMDLLGNIPGLQKFNIKYSLEAFAKRITEHVKHPVNKYDATFIFETGFIEFMIQYPFDIDVPETYSPPRNLQFKGQKRNVPYGYRLYDIDVSSTMDTIKGIIESQVNDKLKGELDFVVLRVDRDKSDIPCEIYYTSETGEKVKLNHTLK